MLNQAGVAAVSAFLVVLASGALPVASAQDAPRPEAQPEAVGRAGDPAEAGQSSLMSASESAPRAEGVEEGFPAYMYTLTVPTKVYLAAVGEKA